MQSYLIIKLLLGITSNSNEAPLRYIYITNNESPLRYMYLVMKLVVIKRKVKTITEITCFIVKLVVIDRSRY